MAASAPGGTFRAAAQPPSCPPPWTTACTSFEPCPTPHMAWGPSTLWIQRLAAALAPARLPALRLSLLQPSKQAAGCSTGLETDCCQSPCLPARHLPEPPVLPCCDDCGSDLSTPLPHGLAVGWLFWTPAVLLVLATGLSIPVLWPARCMWSEWLFLGLRSQPPFPLESAVGLSTFS